APEPAGTVELRRLAALPRCPLVPVHRPTARPQAHAQRMGRALPPLSGGVSAGRGAGGLTRLRRPVVLSALFGAAVVLALFGLGEPGRTIDVLRHFDWRFLLPVL